MEVRCIDTRYESLTLNKLYQISRIETIFHETVYFQLSYH